jgi:hypothetical protein
MMYSLAAHGTLCLKHFRGYVVPRIGKLTEKNPTCSTRSPVWQELPNDDVSPIIYKGSKISNYQEITF